MTCYVTDPSINMNGKILQNVIHNKILFKDCNSKTNLGIAKFAKCEIHSKSTQVICNRNNQTTNL